MNDRLPKLFENLCPANQFILLAMRQYLSNRRQQITNKTFAQLFALCFTVATHAIPLTIPVWNHFSNEDDVQYTIGFYRGKYDAVVQVYNQGTIIKRTQVGKGDKLDIRALPAGVYFIDVLSGSNTSVQAPSHISRIEKIVNHPLYAETSCNAIGNWFVRSR